MKQKNFQHLGLIKKIAWSFHCSTGIDFEDLVSEGILAYHESFEHWDSSGKKGQFSTFIYNCIKNHLTNYCKREMKHHNGKYRLMDTDTDPVLISYKNANSCKNIFESFTKDAQQIAEIVLKNSKRFVALPENKVDPYVLNILAHRGWSQKRAQHGLQELHKALN